MFVLVYCFHLSAASAVVAAIYNYIVVAVDCFGLVTVVVTTIIAVDAAFNSSCNDGLLPWQVCVHVKHKNSPTKCIQIATMKISLTTSFIRILTVYCHMGKG
jgi:hypothetical protein